MMSARPVMPLPQEGATISGGIAQQQRCPFRLGCPPLRDVDDPSLQRRQSDRVPPLTVPARNANSQLPGAEQVRGVENKVGSDPRGDTGGRNGDQPSRARFRYHFASFREPG